MNKEIRRSIRGIAISLLLVLAAGPARALDVLTFDALNPERNEVIGALGFSITHAGSNALPGLDFSLFDFIYVAPSFDQDGLDAFLGSRAGDLDEFLASGGSLVFGSPSGDKTGDCGFCSHIPPSTLPLSDLVQEQSADELAADIVTAVPEPGTYALFALGAAGLFFFRRRLKAKA